MGGVIGAKAIRNYFIDRIAKINEILAIQTGSGIVLRCYANMDISDAAVETGSGRLCAQDAVLTETENRLDSFGAIEIRTVIAVHLIDMPVHFRVCRFAVDTLCHCLHFEALTVGHGVCSAGGGAPDLHVADRNDDLDVEAEFFHAVGRSDRDFRGAGLPGVNGTVIPSCNLQVADLHIQSAPVIAIIIAIDSGFQGAVEIILLYYF